ncbi:MAG: Carbohydrate kinase, FGGY-like, partial [Oscillospiraceae bacterium]|nr:Carbohydrate kinase, FGGY-like [Oscillospiraceae bacterium]
MPTQRRSVLAFDFGASSGRAMLGEFDGKTVKTVEINRFINTPIVINDTLCWD